MTIQSELKLDGGDGGALSIDALGNVDVQAGTLIDVDATLGGGYGGEVDISGRDVQVAATVEGTGKREDDGSNEPTFSGGDGAAVSIDATGNLTVNGTFDIKGGPGGTGGDFEIDAIGNITLLGKVLARAEGKYGAGSDSISVWSDSGDVTVGATLDAAGGWAGGSIEIASFSSRRNRPPHRYGESERRDPGRPACRRADRRNDRPRRMRRGSPGRFGPGDDRTPGRQRGACPLQPGDRRRVARGLREPPRVSRPAGHHQHRVVRGPDRPCRQPGGEPGAELLWASLRAAEHHDDFASADDHDIAPAHHHDDVPSDDDVAAANDQHLVVAADHVHHAAALHHHHLRPETTTTTSTTTTSSSSTLPTSTTLVTTTTTLEPSTSTTVVATTTTVDASTSTSSAPAAPTTTTQPAAPAQCSADQTQFGAAACGVTLLTTRIEGATMDQLGGKATASRLRFSLRRASRYLDAARGGKNIEGNLRRAQREMKGLERTVQQGLRRKRRPIDAEVGDGILSLTTDTRSEIGVLQALGR